MIRRDEAMVDTFNVFRRKPFSPKLDFPLIAILVIGFSLRIVGIGVGLPDYPDPREPLIAREILKLIHFESPPEIYNWPGTAWFYLIAVIGKILEIFGLNPTVPRVIWLGRFTNILLSTGTIWLTYQIGVRFYNRFVGRIGAGLLAVMMLHATNESRFALVDTPATFCVALLLWLCAGNRPVSFHRTVWIGIVVGLGFAVKFTTVFASLSVIALFWGKSRFRSSEFILKLVTVIGAAALSFTLICPYWLIDLFSSEWNRFFEGFFYEASHYCRGHFGLFATGEINWFNRFTYLWTLLRWGMGLPLVSLAIIGLLTAIIERKDGDKILLAFVLFYLLFIGSHKLKFARHLLLIYPAMALFAGASIRQCSRRVALAALGVVGTYSFIYTAAFASVMVTPPTTVEAAEWIASNIPPDEAVEREPEITFDWLVPKLDRGYESEDARWVLVLMPNAEVFLNYAAKPESYSEIDWFPLEIEPKKTLTFYTRIFGDSGQYELVQTFQRYPHFLGIPISDRGAPFPMRALVHPEIRLYRLRE